MLELFEEDEALEDAVALVVPPVVALASVVADDEVSVDDFVSADFVSDFVFESVSFARQSGAEPIVPIKRTTRANRRGFICVPHRFDGFIE